MVVKERSGNRRRGVCCRVEVALEPDRAAQTAELLRVLADPTRLSMLATLRRAPTAVCICDFTAAYALRQPTISHHMGKLKAAGLVESHKEGIWAYYRIAAELPRPVERLLQAVLA